MLSGFTALAKEGLAAAKELQEAAARELQEARSDGISGLERLKRNLQNAALLCQPAGAAGAVLFETENEIRFSGHSENCLSPLVTASFYLLLTWSAFSL